MVKMPSSDEIKKSYTASIPAVSGKYASAVGKTSGVIEAAKRAESLYAQKMQEAIANRSREKGLDKVTDEDWRKAALEKGAARIGPGMAAAVNKQAAGYEPYRSALSGYELPARTADPMTNVNQRVGGVVQLMVNTKRSLMG